VKVEGLPVLNVWRFTLRSLAICRDDKKPFVMQMASRVTTEREAVSLIKRRFTPEWWEGVLIQDVERVGDLHMIEGIPLYEDD
jgi:hypothetical protein